MEKKWYVVLVIVAVLAAAAGFRSSYHTGIQPGYFEKQEAPAYGVSDDKPMGSEFGKEYEEYFKKLYNQE